LLVSARWLMRATLYSTDSCCRPSACVRRGRSGVPMFAVQDRQRGADGQKDDFSSDCRHLAWEETGSLAQ
jgi:hypothetical protein